MVNKTKYDKDNDIHNPFISFVYVLIYFHLRNDSINCRRCVQLTVVNYKNDESRMKEYRATF